MVIGQTCVRGSSGGKGEGSRAVSSLAGFLATGGGRTILGAAKAPPGVNSCLIKMPLPRLEGGNGAGGADSLGGALRDSSDKALGDSSWTDVSMGVSSFAPLSFWVSAETAGTSGKAAGRMPVLAARCLTSRIFCASMLTWLDTGEGVGNEGREGGNGCSQGGNSCGDGTGEGIGVSGNGTGCGSSSSASSNCPSSSSRFAHDGQRYGDTDSDLTVTGDVGVDVAVGHEGEGGAALALSFVGSTGTGSTSGVSDPRGIEHVEVLSSTMAGEGEGTTEFICPSASVMYAQNHVFFFICNASV